MNEVLICFLRCIECPSRRIDFKLKVNVNIDLECDNENVRHCSMSGKEVCLVDYKISISTYNFFSRTMNSNFIFG